MRIRSLMSIRALALSCKRAGRSGLASNTAVMAAVLPLPGASQGAFERRGGLVALPPPGRLLSGGSRFRPRHHGDPPSPRVVAAMRERAQVVDPQLKQRREQLPSGHFHYYATCHPGLEAVVAAELAGQAIGASNIHPGG